MNNKLPSYFRLSFWNIAFFIIFILGLFTIYRRFTLGLGETTSTNDLTPWGLLIGFNILTGVGFAAGGLVLSVVVTVFGMQKYKPLVKPMILTALVVELMVVMALMLDLGKPWNVFHLIYMWNTRSVMFFVGWTVMLYTAVMVLELSPMAFERFKMQGLSNIIKSVSVILVVLGAVLATMHQTLLGTLFMITPTRLYGLWYNPWLPVLFFVQAVGVGLAMVIFISHLSSRTFRKRLEFGLLFNLARVFVLVQVVYLMLRFQAIAKVGASDLLFVPRMETYYFWFEILVGSVIPAILMSIPFIRHNRNGLFWASILGVGGFMVARLNVAVTGFVASSGNAYFPNWEEIVSSIFIVAVGFKLFEFIGRNLPIFDPIQPSGEQVKSEPVIVDISPDYG